jgi:hypothetical protein
MRCRRRPVVCALVVASLVAWVPESWWQSLFLENHDTLAKFWGPVIGPVVAILSFVCSIGNVPLAAVLWSNDGHGRANRRIPFPTASG